MRKHLQAGRDAAHQAGDGIADLVGHQQAGGQAHFFLLECHFGGFLREDVGHAGVQGGPPGDLIILIQEEPHDLYERHGQDLVCDVPISFATAALGGKVDVPTIGGTARLDVPASTQSHRIFRLRGQGLPHVSSNRRGDLLVRVRVWTPKKLSAEEKKVLEKLREVEAAPPSPSKGIFEKIRDSLR